MQESGVMGVYLKAVFDRLREETSEKSQGCAAACQDRWLLKHLKQWNWKISGKHAKFMCDRLGLEYSEPAYYRSIHVWLPDLRWGRIAMPPCVNCKDSSQVESKGYQSNHCGRRVYSMDTHYFIISRRYKCKKCEEKAQETKASEMRAKEMAKEAAQQLGLRVEDAEEIDDPSADEEDGFLEDDEGSSVSAHRRRNIHARHP